LTHVPATRRINSALAFRKSPLLTFALFAVLTFAPLAHVVAEDDVPASCADDAVLVFDASGSMMSSDKDLDGLKRIDRVREAMRKVLPTVAPKKRLGLVTYGPGSANKCENIKVEFTPRLDAAERILEVVEALRPDGRTPLTRAVRTAADILDYRKRPAVIVLLTDGEETCGGATCAVAKSLKDEAAAITVHVVSYRIKESLGPDGIFEARCLADETGGLYISTETTDELIAALEKTLGYPLVTDAR
jgi:Ca-activated chloride channel homolog